MNGIWTADKRIRPFYLHWPVKKKTFRNTLSMTNTPASSIQVTFFSQRLIRFIFIFIFFWGEENRFIH